MAKGNFPEVKLKDFEFSRDIRIKIDDGFDKAIFEWGIGDTLETWSLPVLHAIEAMENFLIWVPWYLVFSIIILITYSATKKWDFSGLKNKPLSEIFVIVTKNWIPTVTAALMLLLCGIVGLWVASMQTVALMVTATIMAIIIGTPIGIAMSRFNWIRNSMLPVLDLMQTLPIFVYLIPFVMIFGPGKVPALLATLVFALPPVIRLTDLGIRHVDAEIIEAVTAFGSTPRQKLFTAQLPLALPTIMAGINQTTMLALSMVVIASMIGAGGLGFQVLQGINRLEIGRGLLSGIAIVFLAIVFDRIAQSYGKKMQQHLYHTND